MLPRISYEAFRFKDGTSLVPRELHGHAFGHTGPHEVSDGGPSEVVWDPARTARVDPRLAPRFVERTLSDALPRLLALCVAEDVSYDRPVISLQRLRDGLLILQAAQKFFSSEQHTRPFS